MPIYNIYPYVNAEDDVEPTVTVEVSADGTDILNIEASDTETRANAERTLRDYVAGGFTPVEAVERYAGPYGEVAEVNEDGTRVEPVVAAVKDEEVSEPEPEPEPEVEPEAASEVESEGEATAQPEPTATDAEPFTIGEGLMAMTEDDGTVVTLLRRDPTDGAVYRHDGAWHPMVDPTVLDGLSFVGVTEDSEAVYDEHEAKDELIDIGNYSPSAEGPYWPDIVVLPGEPKEEDEYGEAIAASALVNSAADLAEAIAAAAADPDLRWYVERRVAALGLKASLPWLEG
jgi:hypothetical protein